MIIRSFSIDRFGILAGQKVPELSPGLNIFLGDNEAGKSTLLNFFRAMFFGYKRSNRFVLDYLPPAKGAALSGGGLLLESSRGTVFNLLRRPDKNEPMLSDAAGKNLPASFLAELLSGYTDKMYDEVFCFGYRELSSLDGMNKEEVAGVLHSAAFGLGFNSPVRVSNELALRQKELFNPLGKKSRVYLLGKELEEARKQLAQLAAEQDDYNAIKAAQEELASGLAGLKSAAADLLLALERNSSLRSAWTDWEALLSKRAELELNPHPGGHFALENMERFDDLLRQLEDKRAESLEKREQIRQGREGLARLAELAPLEAVWPDCQLLLARKNSLQQALEGAPRLKAALEESREAEAAQARRLGWSLEQALAFDITMALQNGLAHWRGELETARRLAEQNAHEARRLADEAAELLDNVNLERQSLGRLVAEPGEAAVTLALYSPEARLRLERSGQAAQAAQRELAEAQKSLEALTDERAALEEEKIRLAQELAQARAQAAAAAEEAEKARPRPLFSLQTARQDTRRVPFMLLALALAFLCFSGTYKYFDATGLGQDSWHKFTSLEAWKIYLSGDWLIFGLGLGFLWAAFYWLAPRAATLGRWRPKNPWEGLLSPAEREAEAGADAALWRLRLAEERLEKLAEALTEAGAGREAFAAADRAAQKEWARQAALYALPPHCPPAAALRIFDLGLFAAQAGKKAAQAAESAAQADQALAQARSGWVDWLARYGFAADFTPDTVPHALQLIKEIQNQAAESAARAAGLEAAEAEQASFALALDDLCARAAFTPGGAGPLERFDALWGAASSAHDEFVLLQSLEAEIGKNEAELARIDEVARSHEARFTGLLAQAQAADEADYRLRFGRHLAHAALRLEEELLLSRLEQAAGKTQASSGQRLWENSKEFMDALRASALEDLRESGEAMKKSLSELEEQQGAVEQQRGENRLRLERLESGRGSEELQAKEAALRDEFKAVARQWAVAVMAQSFIRQAQRSFEEGRHDSVISRAGEILSGLTGGRYKKLRFDLGGKGAAYAVSESGESLDSAGALSRGTREQLYLALRLAFIRQQNLTQESLPLIMDDILVNFDAGRAKNAAEIFAAFTAENQGLFFTCHPHMAELLKRTAPQSRLFGIAAGQIKPLEEK